VSKLGRPTDYSEEKLALARIYLEGGWEEQGDVVPQIAGLALAMGVDRTTVYDWAKHEDKIDFSYIFTRVQAIQERGLINKGLSGDFNPAITKMMLTKHGYSDKQEIDHSSSDSTMSPTRIVIEAASADSEDKATT
jgi:hypothetical protein